MTVIYLVLFLLLKRKIIHYIISNPVIRGELFSLMFISKSLIIPVVEKYQHLYMQFRIICYGTSLLIVFTQLEAKHG